MFINEEKSKSEARRRAPDFYVEVNLITRNMRRRDGEK